MQLISSILLTISLTALSVCGTNPVLQTSSEQPKINSWIIEITTSGGVDGLGEGGWMLDSQGGIAAGRELEDSRDRYRLTCKGDLSEAELQKVSQLVSSAEPSEWSAWYVDPQEPYGYADDVEILFELRYRTSDRNESVHTTSWDYTAMN